MIEGFATFPGVENILKADMLLCRGPSPSSCLLRVTPDILDAPEVGDLVIGDANGLEVRFRDCAINRGTIRHEQGVPSTRMSVQVLDRRWKWRDQEIEGEYNLRKPNGELIPATKKNARELAKILLDAMGEVNPNYAAIPNDVYPLVTWKCAVPALELERLANSVGCTIVLRLDDTVMLCQLGEGQTLPDDDDLMYEPAVVVASRTARQIRVCAGDVIWQCKWKLEPVGREPNGDVVRLTSLSYMPSGGWSGQWWSQFAGVADSVKTHAFATVWRWYRVTLLAEGGLTPQLSPKTVDSIEQHLPIMEPLLSPVAFPDGAQGPSHAFVEGEFWTQGETGYNSAAGTIYPGSFRLFGDKGIVEFPYPMVRIVQETVEPADLYLTATCRLRFSDGNAGYGYSRNIGQTGFVHLLRRPELGVRVIQNYDGVSLTGTTHNRSNVDEEAMAYAEAIEPQYEGEWQDHTYVGIKAYDLDGAVAQAQWSINAKHSCSSRFSRMHEFSPFAKDSAQRHREQQTDRLIGES